MHNRSVVGKLVPLAFLLIACQQTEVRLYEQNGKTRIEPTNIAGADYVVHIRNQVDIGFGFDPNVRSQRNAIALRTMAAQCPNGTIVKEDAIELGGPGAG